MAAGADLAVFFPMDNEPGTASYATLDFRNLHPVLDFDDAADENAVFSGVMPHRYSGGGVVCYLHWTGATATSGSVVWDASWERIAEDDLDVDADSFAAVQSVTDGTNGTSGKLNVCSIAFANGAQMDYVAAGELFRLKINRDANNGSDGMTGDAELHAVVVRETP